MRFTFVILTAALCLNAWGSTETSDEAIIQAAEKLIKEGAETKPAAPATAAASAAATGTATAMDTAPATATGAAATEAAITANTKESEIPVFLNNKASDKATDGMIWRLVGSLAIVAVVAGGALYATKRWSRRKDQGGSKARIEIMHQLHLGPRKSLALVRVAGEVMLIGMTDHNINMLKPVTLIDDELEGVINKDFNNFLEDEFSVEDVRTALGARV